MAEKEKAEAEEYIRKLAEIWKRKLKKAGGRKTGEKKGGR